MIIPQPQKTEQSNEKFYFSDVYALKFCNEEYKNAARYLKMFLNISKNAEAIIIFEKNESFSKEEYVIEFDRDIKIISQSECGAYRAVSTLKQLAALKEIKIKRIHDYPVVKNRGVMLDISRGKVPKIEKLYKLADILSDLKYNQLQLYMDGFVYEFEHFLKYCEDTMPIKREELKSFIRYCEDRFITLVPNQNGFGHMEKWLKKPELSHLAIKRDDKLENDTLNPLKEESLELVKTIYKDLFSEFPTDIGNIGMDEPFALGMGETREICEKVGKRKIYVEYLNKVIKYVSEDLGKTPMFWDDIIFEEPELIKEINPDSIVLDWGYEAESPFVHRCKFLKENNLKFYTCPGTSTWLSITGRFDNMTKNIEEAAKACINYDGEGVLLTDWGDMGHPQSIAMSFLAYIYNACCTWNYRMNPELMLYSSCSKCLNIIEECEKYADEFIFEGNKISKLIHKMSNYYLLENRNRVNFTNLWEDVERIFREEEPFLDSFTAKQIENYMSAVKEELLKFDDNTPFIDGIRCNCDMVILWSGFIGKRYDGLEEKLEKLKEEFLVCRNKRNREWGSEIVLSRINNMIRIVKGEQNINGICKTQGKG